MSMKKMDEQKHLGNAEPSSLPAETNKMSPQRTEESEEHIQPQEVRSSSTPDSQSSSQMKAAAKYQKLSKEARRKLRRRQHYVSQMVRLGEDPELLKKYLKDNREKNQRSRQKMKEQAQ